MSWCFLNILSPLKLLWGANQPSTTSSHWLKRQQEARITNTIFLFFSMLVQYLRCSLTSYKMLDNLTVFSLKLTSLKKQKKPFFNFECKLWFCVLFQFLSVQRCPRSLWYIVPNDQRFGIVFVDIPSITFFS